MTDITDARALIQIEEVENGAGVSTGTWNKIGGSVNFINNRQNKAFEYKFLGPYRPLFGGEDGVRAFIYPTEIVGFSGYVRVSGTSGTTTIDIHSITGSTDNGSILTVKPSITSAADNGIVFFTNLVTGGNSAGTGITLPTFATTQFDSGDGIRVDLDSNASDAFDLSLTIHYRPR